MHLLVAVEVLIDAGAAARAVFARETIEQALVAFAPVAVAIAGLLVQRFLDLRGNGVGVLHHEIRKTLRIHGFRSVFRISWCKRSEEHTSELQSRGHLVCRLLLEKKKKKKKNK